ncbi:hypothetical protein [Ilumatobacter sp.]|uniref:hypothetical protein n=1 Tax=Ilumatobacter sp. TaxID=1967498 RepID=UPI003C31FC79
MRTTWIPIALATALVTTACGASDDSTDDTTDTAETEATDVTEPTEAAEVLTPVTDDPTDDEAESAGTDAAAGGEAADEVPPDAGSGTATLTLANGESYDFSVLCALEPQIAAGSEILFTATSYDDPLLDITQFGDEGPVTGIGSVTVADASNFESLWGASTMYEPFGGTLELTLDGSTIRGTGSFYAGDDPIDGGDPVDGDVVANC